MSERISEAEWQVMEVLWTQHPLTAQDVAARLQPTGWGLTTVKTLLSRLAAKGALHATEDGRRYLYAPAVDRAAIAAGESRRLVDRLFGGRPAPLVAVTSRLICCAVLIMTTSALTSLSSSAGAASGVVGASSSFAGWGSWTGSS